MKLKIVCSLLCLLNLVELVYNNEAPHCNCKCSKRDGEPYSEKGLSGYKNTIYQNDTNQIPEAEARSFNIFSKKGNAKNAFFDEELIPTKYPCNAKNYGRGSVVCICDEKYCDRPRQLNINPKSKVVQIYTSSKAGARLTKTTVKFKKLPSSSSRNRNEKSKFGNIDTILGTIEFDYLFPGKSYGFELVRNKKYQKVIGLGASFTDAAGQNIFALSEIVQTRLMRSYFGPWGNNYDFGRVPIGGTDFSPREYSLDDSRTADPQLLRFSIQPEDYKYKIPLIHWAQKLMGTQSLRLIASPWSAPGWMKTNNKLTGRGFLKPKFYQAYANYIVKFLEGYKANNISIWGMTTGNEPSNGYVPLFPFNCMGWSPTDCSKWIANNLGPTLKKSFPSVKIIIMDDNKDQMSKWGKNVIGKPAYDSAKYVFGIGTHWYFDFITDPASDLTDFHNTYPNQAIIQTEACSGFGPWQIEKVIFGSWERAEEYISAIIRDMSNFVGGWIDWNLAVDLKGGPNWARLAADAAILVDKSKNEFLKQPIYYAMGQFSRFIIRDSVRVLLEPSSHVPSYMKYVAFQRPDKGIVIVLYNSAFHDSGATLYEDSKGYISILIPARSIRTVIYW